MSLVVHSQSGTIRKTHLTAPYFEEAERWLEAVVREGHGQIFLLVFRGMVRRAPVLTGAFRFSIMPSLDAPSRWAPELGAPFYPVPGDERIVPLLRRLRPFGRSFIVSNLPYANRIENGWSSKAPAGTAQVSIQAVSVKFLTTRLRAAGSRALQAA